MSNENPATAEESWATTNAKMDDERERKNTEHRERHIGRKAEVVAKITVPRGAEIIPVAEKGEIVDIIDADCNRHISNDVKIRTADGREEWVDSMCLRVQK